MSIRFRRSFLLRPLVLIAFAALVLGQGCKSGQRDDPILRLSASEALEIGKQYLADEKYFKARQHLTHAFEVEPNSRGGREALLLAADALYLDGGRDNFIKCEAKYRDFLNRFPTSDRADYAQFQVANCLSRRTSKPDRDQLATHKALEAYLELLRLYPNTQYTTEAHEMLAELEGQLAAHELSIANFYLRIGGVGICTAAISRLEYLQENYPEYDNMDEVLFGLGVAYGRCQRILESADAFGQLREEYPQSKYVGQIEGAEKEIAKLIGKMGKRG